MSKTASNKLFVLIKSLSGPEKRYFKLFSKYYSLGRDSKYLSLFEAIDKQKEYDDAALRKTMYHTEVLESRKFSELKAYLFDVVLRSLQSYKESKEYPLKISRQLNNISILFGRSLFQESLDQVKKAKSMANANEDFGSLIQLLEWEKKIPFVQGKNDLLDKSLQQIEKESVSIRGKFSDLIGYRNLYYKIMLLIRTNPLDRNTDENFELELIIKDPLLAPDKKFISIRAESLYHRILALYHYTRFNYESFNLHSGLLVKILESNPIILETETSEYISALSNFALSCGLLENYSEVQETLDKFLVVQPKTEDDKIKIHWQYYALSFSLSIYTGEFEKGKLLLQEHFEKVKAFARGSFQNSSLYHSYFYIFFGVGEFENALEYLNKWLSLPRANERQDLQGIVQILNLIIHYEIGNSHLLEYLLRSSYRFLKKRNRLFDFEKRVISFITDAEKITNPNELKARFSALKKDFEALEKIPSEKVVFQYFDFIAWLDSKIKDISFQEAVRRRYLKRM